MVNIPKQYRRKPVATTDRAGIAQFDSTYFTVSDGVVSLASGAVSTVSGLTDTTIAAAASGHVLIYDGSDSWDNKAVSGDCTLAATGAMTVTDLTITSEAQGDLLYFDGSNWVRLAAKTDGQILVGDGTDLASVAVSGDCTLANSGAMTVTDLTISSEAQGDILYFDSSNWVRLAAGTNGQALLTQGAGANPQWGTPAIASATGIANSCTLNDAGANDAVLSFTTQTVGSPTLTIPDFANVDDTFCFVTLAQTLANKTLTSPVLNTGVSGTAFLDEDDMSTNSATQLASQQSIKAYVDSGTVTMTNKTLTAPKIVTTGFIADAGGDEYLTFVESATPVNYLTVTSADTGNAPSLTAGGSDANVDLLLHGKATGNVYVADGTDNTKDLTFELSGATTAKTMTIASSQTDDRTITLPDATGTVVLKDSTDTFTNKTIDCDGTGNAISNVNLDELDPVAVPSTGDASDTVYGVMGILHAYISNQAAAVNIYNSNAPFKFRIVRAWSINRSADGGTWKLNNGAAGAGTDITNAVTVAANDQDIDEPTDYDDSVLNIASSGSLSIVPDGGGALDCDVYIEIMRVD